MARKTDWGGCVGALTSLSRKPRNCVVVEAAVVVAAAMLPDSPRNAFAKFKKPPPLPRAGHRRPTRRAPLPTANDSRRLFSSRPSPRDRSAVARVCVHIRTRARTRSALVSVKKARQSRPVTNTDARQPRPRDARALAHAHRRA